MLKKTFLIALMALSFAATSRTQAWDPWPDCFPCPDDKLTSGAVERR
jgi:hypothetical protein